MKIHFLIDKREHYKYVFSVQIVYKYEMMKTEEEIIQKLTEANLIR